MTVTVTDPAAQLAAVSAWIDQHNHGMTPTEHLWSRIAKISEENGEVVAAVLGMLGENPRKGVTHDREDVVAELLDVACTALAAVEHMSGNDGSALYCLTVKIDGLYARMLRHEQQRTAVPQ